MATMKKITAKIPTASLSRIYDAKKIGIGITLKQILENPKAGEILAKHEVPRMLCPYVSFELEELKIGKVAKIYGLDLRSILKELNNE